MVADCKQPRKEVCTNKGEAKPAPKPKAEPKAKEQAEEEKGLLRRDISLNNQGRLRLRPRQRLPPKLLQDTLWSTGPLYLSHHILLSPLPLQDSTEHALSTPLFIQHFTPLRCQVRMVC